MTMSEVDQIKERYIKRNKNKLIDNYSASLPYIYMSRQEKERQLYSIFEKLGYESLADISLLEIGCGRGGKILDLFQMGFSPDRIIGNELMPDNIEEAKQRLPKSVQLFSGDARDLEIIDESLDIVYQSMVFSSILDDDFQQELANRMWQWVKPGGGVLWYDFTVNNPNNKDVRGVTVARIRELFPDAKVILKRVTLAPPISRRVTKIHPSFYNIFNMLPFLRSHVLCFLEKTGK